MISQELIGALIISVVGLILGVLISYYFKSIRDDLDKIEVEVISNGKIVAALGALLKQLSKDIRANTDEQRDMNRELRAIWRYVDAPKRSTDIRSS